MLTRVDRTHLAGVTYRAQWVHCGNERCRRCRDGAPSHGPYWYAYWRTADGRRSRYLGDELPADVVAALLAGDVKRGQRIRRRFSAEVPTPRARRSSSRRARKRAPRARR